MKITKQMCTAQRAVVKQSYTSRTLSLRYQRGEQYHPSWNVVSKTWLAVNSETLDNVTLAPLHIDSMTTSQKKKIANFMKANGYRLPPEFVAEVPVIKPKNAFAHFAKKE